MANVEGSIYRVEGGVAVPYANLKTVGDTAEREIYNAASRFTINSNLGTTDEFTANAFICGYITILHFYIQPSAATLTLGEAGTHSTLPLVTYSAAVGDDYDVLLQPFVSGNATANVICPVYAYVGGERKVFKGNYRRVTTAGGTLQIEFDGQVTFQFDTYSGFTAEALFINNAS